jgi:hypothetical protein
MSEFTFLYRGNIEAKDLAQAVELSKGCPILEVGGSVEVRPIRILNM